MAVALYHCEDKLHYKQSYLSVGNNSGPTEWAELPSIQFWRLTNVKRCGSLGRSTFTVRRPGPGGARVRYITAVVSNALPDVTMSPQ